ncbi:hypothetical protein QFC19_003598 [Naganishia cerealis]|uniref:Uncharacterized protein n=1 Tax=Naganishia cerealis TaxID=610337 RepID=A0ACC2W1D2_9TREE|nr:hypothetical protein QFC19_003598 [Naganishia cerealis]
MAASSSNVDLQRRELSAEPAHASSPAPEHAPINASQIHIAQETSKSSSRTFVESDNAQREGVQSQRSNSDRGFTHHRTPASGPIVFHESNPDLEPHPIYVLPDKFSEPVSVMDQTQERSRKRAYADVQPSEGSRKKQRLEIINQKCMSQLFPFGKDDGYTQHICEPSRSITSSTLLLQKPQQQMDAKGSTHADGIAAGRKTYPFNLQDEQRKTRKTFSMPIPEYSLFYATPKASFSSVARMKKPYLAKCGSFNPRECRDDEMAGFIRERSIGKLEGMSPNLTSKVVSRDACTAVQVSSSTIANATWGPSSTEVGKLDSVTITRTSSAALPRQEQAGISVEQESSQQSVVFEASIEQRVREEAQRLPPDVS